MPLACSNCNHDCFLEFAVGDNDPTRTVLICMECGTTSFDSDMGEDDLTIDDLKRLVVVCENFNPDR